MYDIQGTVTISLEDFNEFRDRLIEAEQARNHAEFELEQLRIQNQLMIEQKFITQVEVVKALVYDHYWEEDSFKENDDLPLYVRTNLDTVQARAMDALIQTKQEWIAIVHELKRQVEEAAAKAELDRLAEEALAGTPEEKVEATEE
jgi:hypothetical protein